MPATAALSVICASTAIAGVVGGLAWLAYVFVVTLVLAAAGTAMRAMRVPGLLIWVGQLFVLLCLVVTLFTSTGVFAVLPGPAALGQLGSVLSQSVTEVQVGVPPVPGDAPILCLIVVSIGLVAVAVDNLAVTARVPATAGLILLCVYAVPASLDDGMLPWWSFVLGAAAFTLMLGIDGVARHQAWRGKLGLPAAASTGAAPAAVAITAVAAIVALFVGGTFTLVGTVGRLPGVDGNGTGGNGNLGINPFTKLSGLLQNKANTELFDVTGLSSGGPYLQALTLSTYEPGVGFVPNQQMPAGVPADGALSAAQEPTSRNNSVIHIEPKNWEDVWLPIFGVPQQLQGVSDDYHYDQGTDIVFAQHAEQPGNYVERVSLTEPSASDLEQSGAGYGNIGPQYTAAPGVDKRVTTLAQNLTASASTEFDRTTAIYNFFRGPNSGFTYSTSTETPHVADPLVDFLFYGKTGFCEQYATAMAVMLREVGIPVRVAIGFTDGYTSGGKQIITSQDAHAWDEVYFADYGWITFDPTPLGDGRSHTPTYLDNNNTNSGTPGSTGSGGSVEQPDGRTPTNQHTNPTPSPANAAPVAQSGGQSSGVPGWHWWTLAALLVLSALATGLTLGARRPGPLARLAGGRIGRWHQGWLLAAVLGWAATVFFLIALVSWWLAALAVVLGAAAAPTLIREVRRRQRHQAVVARGPAALSAAWAEVLAESWDRGTEITDTVTLRVAAHKIVKEHGLDDEGRAGLRTLVGAVERSWYGAPVDESGLDGAADGVTAAFDDVRRSMDRNAPLALRARLLPRSVLRPSKWWRTK
jgi:hypothetical protein